MLGYSGWVPGSCAVNTRRGLSQVTLWGYSASNPYRVKGNPRKMLFRGRAYNQGRVLLGRDGIRESIMKLRLLAVSAALFTLSYAVPWSVAQSQGGAAPKDQGASDTPTTRSPPPSTPPPGA